MAVAIPLVFGAAGAWLAPAGFAALGYTIGATIGSMLFAPKQQDQHFYGARLQDLRATQVEYGSPIHVRLGQTRGAGTVVWQSDFREVATTTTQESGGKGGGGGATYSQTTYSYFVDLLLLVNDIPSSGLLRVWKNNELVYNLSPTATDADIVATTSTEHWAAIRFYGGAADQLPDPDYEAAKGVGNVPAHRGSTTIFIKNLALGGGDMLPSLEFEIFTTDGTYIIRIIDADTLASPDVDSSDLLSDAIADAFTGTWPVIVTQWTATGSRPYSFNTTTHIYPMTVDDAGNLVAAGATSYGNPITNPPANASLADSSLVTLATPDNLTYPIALSFDWRSGDLGVASANITAFKARQTAEWNGLLTSQAAALATIDAIPDLVTSGQVGGTYYNLYEAEDARDALIAANPVEDTTLGEVISGTAALAIAEVITNAGETGCSIEWTGTFTGKKRIVKRVTKSYAVTVLGSSMKPYVLWHLYGLYAPAPQTLTPNQPKWYKATSTNIFGALLAALYANPALLPAAPTGVFSYYSSYSPPDHLAAIYTHTPHSFIVYGSHGAPYNEVSNDYGVTETATTSIIIEDLPAATASFTASAEQAALVGGFAVDYTAPIGDYDFSVGQPYTITTNLFNGAVPTSIESLSLQSAVAQLCNFSGLDAGDIDVSALSDAASNAGWVEDSPILFAADAVSGDYYGESVALSSDGLVLAVGASSWEGAAADQGGVYIYDFNGSIWVQRGAVLTAGDASVFDQYGSSVALSSDGSILVVGARTWEGASADQGGVYIYDWNGSTWVQRGAVLTAGDAASSDRFGVSVALSANGLVLAVGAFTWEGTAADQGCVYIYDWNSSAWVQRGAVLTAGDAATNDYFGSSVALSDDGSILAIGAPDWEGAATNQGGVYIHDWNGSTWVQRGAVLTGDIYAFAGFGLSVALSGDGNVLIVGQTDSPTINYMNQGVVSVFDYSGAAWIERPPKITASDAASFSVFGYASAISSDGSKIVVGAPYSDSAAYNAGAVYTFDEIPADLSGVVHGLTITTSSNMRQPIESLMGSYYFTACQSGDKVKFTPRGGSSLATFAHDDLGASFGDSTESALSFNMASDTELPSRMSVTYQVKEGDYQKDTQMSDRIVTAETNTVSDVMLPIIFTAEQAKGVAITNALDAQVSLMSAKIKVLFDHPELEPGDVVTVTDRDGSQYRMRITQIMDSFPIREFDLVLDDASILTYSGITTADFYSQTVVIPLVDSDGLYLDIPILSDINNDAGFYVVSGPVAEGKWYGAVTLQSDNDLDYVSGVEVPERGYFGTCSTTLGDWTGYHVFDEQNSITFTLPTDAVLTSSTRAGILASPLTNAFLIGNEIIQAVNCTEISAGVWKLTRLLRGLRGTEWAMVDHGAGERAVWLRADGMRRLPMSNSLLGLSRYYKTFSVGRNAADYDGEAFTNMAIGMKPFSPTTARGARDLSGNLTITWQRRTRLSCRYGGAMGVSIPLGENVEQYEIDIYDDNTYTTVLRTITATSESAEYTAAQQVTDFGSAQAQVYVKIYQISQTVVRGYALTGAV